MSFKEFILAQEVNVSPGGSGGSGGVTPIVDVANTLTADVRTIAVSIAMFFFVIACIYGFFTYKNGITRTAGIILGILILVMVLAGGTALITWAVEWANSLTS